MNAICVLYGGSLNSYALQGWSDGLRARGSALEMALEKAARFPGVTETLLLLDDEGSEAVKACVSGIKTISRPGWTTQSLLETLAESAAGFDFLYYAWADCPLLDPGLAASLAERHLQYKAEYSYADGWPYGFASELLSPGAAAILAKIAAGDASSQERPQRDSLFRVLQKDINAFDIEVEISAVDLRSLRLSLAADCKRNYILLQNLFDAGLSSAADAEAVFTKHPQALRVAPAFYAIQVSGDCPQACSYCPYPKMTGFNSGQYMPLEQFEALLDKIVAFSGEAVIDISLWGEAALHPRKLALIEAVLSRPGLSLIVETSGLGWKSDELEALKKAQEAALEKNAYPKPWLFPPAPLNWIVSLDASDPLRYAELRGGHGGRGGHYEEALHTAEMLFTLFPASSYVQAVRMKTFEDDTEKFYQYWERKVPNKQTSIIIQKYDDFCGFLEKRQASDLSPIRRSACWHLMRDMSVLIDGRVLRCREELMPEKAIGNAFEENLEDIWKRMGAEWEQCGGCDEYYTFNF